MELDDFKNTWDEMSNHIKAKQHLNLKIFDDMSKRKFHSSLKKIILPEIFASVICIGCAVFIGLNLDKLNTIFFKIVGVISILLFVLLPAISLMSIQQLYKSADIHKSYADTLKDFAVQKIKFCKLQKLNFVKSSTIGNCDTFINKAVWKKRYYGK